MEYQRRGKKRVEPSAEAQLAHSDVHTPHDDSTSGQQNAQASVGAQTPPRQTPPVDQQAILLTTLQTLTSLVQSMVSNQRSNASPSGNTSAPLREKATAVSYQQFMAMQPPIFSGGGSHDKAKEWIEEVERIFGLLKVPKENKVNYGSYLLNGDAKNWWQSTSEIRFAGQLSIS
uniref:Retrotransposon gag domain-containing protein n=1 Tax=Nymphaea colorata TaxID=210225 RepID=A0A5K0UZJ1_9MAGN